MSFPQIHRSLRGLVVLALVLALGIPVVAGEFKIDLRTVMSGPAFNGVIPKGKAGFQLEAATRKLSIEVNNVNLPALTPVNVLLNGVKIGSITIRNQGGTLLLSTFAGQAVPMISPGNKVAITFGGSTVLSGTF